MLRGLGWVMAMGSLQLLPAAEAAEAAAQASPQASAQASAPVQPAAVQKNFPILEYRVEGNTLLQPIDIERAVTGYLGESRSIKDIETARAELEKAYHDHGYKTVLVNIPEQQVSDGVVRLKVTEAPVGQLKIAGSRFHSLKAIRDKMAQFNQGTVPNFDEVQKELGDVNRSPDLRVAPVLKASETPGQIDVELRVTDDLPVHATVEVDNRYSANTTHTRATGELRYDNLFQTGQSVSLQYQVAPEHPADAKVGSLSYVIPTAGNHVWALYAVHSDSNVAAVGDLNVIGRGDIFGVRYISTLPTDSRDFFHSFTAGLDYKKFKQAVILQGATDSIESPVTYPPFLLEYSGTWMGPAPDDGSRWVATTAARSNTTLDVTTTFLIRGLGTDWRQFANKRANAGTSYIILRPSLGREQVLPAHWSLAARVDGQLASGPLFNTEEFSAGGADSVRGYTESELLGDNGIRGSLELRTPQLLARRFEKVDESYFFLFTDAAKLTILQPLPNQEASFSIASAGVGLRFKGGGFAVALDGARILKDGATTFAGRYRGLFKMSYAY